MIFKSFILGNLVSLCMKILNSVVVVGLYYGFLTTFSMGPSYLFLLRARVIEEGEEGTEKKVSATTGFITGQLMMFISIYYAPLHLALGRPHTITVLALPYLLFHFFWNNHKHFFDYGSTTRNEMRNLSIQFVFLNNLIFQLFNHFILPSSMLVRLVNIYMFRCNNKMLFVTSSFVGWLIGHILFMKWVGLILVWIQQNNSIRSNVLFRSNKYLVSELRNSMARIFSILLFITCVYSLGRTPSPIFTKKLKETSETEESEEETDVETTSETKGTKQEQEGSTEEDPSSSLFSEEKEDPDKIDETEEIQVNGKEKTKDEFHFHFKETCYKNRPLYETFYLDGNQENSKLEILIEKKKKDLLWVEKPLVTILFDSKRWNRPFRYIKNHQFENALRREMGQYFFSTCLSDGKERISFMYPPSLSTFLELIQRKMSLFIIKKFSSDELYNHWNSKNEQKKKKISNEFINRVQALDKGYLASKTLEKRTRLCNEKNKEQYLPKTYDPLLNGSYRGKIQFFFSSSILNKTFRTNFRERFWINKIHLILLITNYQEFETKADVFNSNHESFLREIAYLLNLINELDGKSRSNFNFQGLSFFPDNNKEKMNLENQIKILQFLFDRVIATPKKKTSKKFSTRLKEISKQVPRWSYKLINDLEQQEGKDDAENLADDHEIRSRKAKLLMIFSDNIMIFNDNQQNNAIYTNIKDRRNPDPIYIEQVTFIRYSQQSDFRRDIIKGSMRAQRRKITIFELFQANAHSPFFLDRLNKSLFFFFSFDIDIYELMKTLFINCRCKNTEFKISNSTYLEKKTKESKKKEESKRKDNKREDKARIKIAETWDRVFLAQVLRGCVLVTQSNLRKYIILPSLIITKNIIRILFFQTPEWSDDLKDWSREMHVKCTYNGVQLSEKEFPKNWLTSGIQIKILFPFRLKPWHRSKVKFPHKSKKKTKVDQKDFCFLTIWGMEAELPFGSPRKRLSLFKPIFKKLEKKIIKIKKKGFRVITILEERRKLFQNLSKEKKHWVKKNIFFRQEKKKKFSKSKRNQKFLSEFREVDQLNESKKEKDSILNNNNWTVSKLSTPIGPSTNYSLIEKKMQDLSARRKIILNQIEKITKEKKKKFRTSQVNISPNKIKKSSNAKKFKSSNNISHILQKKNARLVRKFYFFIKILIENIYLDIFLGIINIPRLNAQLFLESIKKIITKYISNNESNHKKIDKPNKKKLHFISILKKSRDIAVINNNSQIFCDISFVSQAYVFYKLSQTQILNLYKLRLIFQYHNLFLKNEIKDYFRAQGFFNSELKEKNFRKSFSLINQWKNWLRSHYQYKYDLSQHRWSRLIPENCRNRIFQHHMVENTKLNKWNLHEQDQLIHYEKKNDFEVDFFANQKDNFKKHSRYSLLSYKSLNYEKKTDFFISESPTNKEEILSNSNTNKRKFFDILESIPINNYLAEDDIINIEKSPDRKYFDWRILNFSLRKRVDSESWIDTGSKDKKKTKTPTNKYQIIDKSDKKNISFLPIYQDQEINLYKQNPLFFDWMGMNEEIENSLISNFELWFFRKFLIFYNTYKRKPWTIPIQFLFFNFHKNENISKNKKINGNKKGDLLISIPSQSNEKKIIEFENRNYEENESDDQMDFGAVFANEEKDIEEDYMGLDMKNQRNKNQNKSHTEVELDFFLKEYLCFQLRWNGSLNHKIIDNIKAYCFLLRLTNPREIILSSIQRQEINLNILMVQKDVTLTELMKKRILIIEPVRLSVKTDGQFILYQMMGILLVHKNKEQINKKYREKFYVDKNKKNFTESIERHHNIIGNREKNDYDLLVPENILSPKRRRELRIQISFNLQNKKDIHIHRNTEIVNGNNINIKKGSPILDKSKHFWREKHKLIKLKFFLWPNFRLEDLACMNRYWFDTNNGSRFSMVRIYIYPRLKFE
uniref:Ycf1 protein n=1 Tax=Euphorbia jolkinii TaxID=457253 RepID=UPI0028FCAD83|nr:Ycf1 protein [Euphorbia jolkinii]WNA17721.1 Ycf1 protein [Euphorbia jolkinii]WNA17806.1 Ycf1 protein [Euphorbia jolkinii]WNA17891.1 Ycf1 protein [Euphorbia jolkinii]WNA18146.1 Ycf1 protein [Euphorbia jolkinii]WNA18231.1 Ycf1 protein [Euphorbia jolkinii]